VCMPPVRFCLLMCVYSLMLLCTHLSEFLMNKDVYIGYDGSFIRVLARIICTALKVNFVLR